MWEDNVNKRVISESKSMVSWNSGITVICRVMFRVQLLCLMCDRCDAVRVGDSLHDCNDVVGSEFPAPTLDVRVGYSYDSKSYDVRPIWSCVMEISSS